MNTIKITTLNIRCFGFGGDYFSKNRAEHRISHLRSFVSHNFESTDVFVFQEIMTPLILDRILPAGFKMYSYQHTYSRHMFIVFACRRDLDIKIDFTWFPKNQKKFQSLVLLRLTRRETYNFHSRFMVTRVNSSVVASRKSLLAFVSLVSVMFMSIRLYP